MKIRKNDKVKVTAGKDKDRQGTVEKVLVKKNKVIVTGVNMYKKHVKPRGQNKSRGGIIDITMPLPVASVVLICPKCGKPTRVGYQQDKDGTKNRVCKKCREVI